MDGFRLKIAGLGGVSGWLSERCFSPDFEVWSGLGIYVVSVSRNRRILDAFTEPRSNPFSSTGGVKLFSLKPSHGFARG